MPHFHTISRRFKPWFNKADIIQLNFTIKKKIRTEAHHKKNQLLLSIFFFFSTAICMIAFQFQIHQPLKLLQPSSGLNFSNVINPPTFSSCFSRYCYFNHGPLRIPVIILIAMLKLKQNKLFSSKAVKHNEKLRIHVSSQINIETAINYFKASRNTYNLHAKVRNLLQQHTNPLAIIWSQIILEYFLKFICETTNITQIFTQVHISSDISI